MTLSKAILNADETRRNEIKEETKREWIEELDRLIWREVICTHEGEHGEMPTYTFASDEDELLAHDPYSVIYPRYIVMKIDEGTQELGKFNNSSAAFNRSYEEFTAWYNRTHMPLQEAKIRV